MIGQGFAFAGEERAADALRLRDLLGDVRAVLNGAFRQYYWIVAEVSEVSRSNAGHYYFDLIDPEPDGRTAASVRANLWARNAARIVPAFREVTRQDFQKGMELMMQVKVEMSLQYGFSLTITDINPEYTLGNIERRREATIKRLQSDGVMDLNKQYPLPSLLLRVAVISSETAAGYGDFMTTIRQSGLGDFFSIKLFQAAMQGSNTTLTVNSAFAKIFYYREDFDAVFIMRGGGSKQDLAAFDDYDLCSTIANFPLPVLTAIGHEQDTSIADMVAHTRLKTPTALGEFLVGRLTDQLLRVHSVREKLPKTLGEKLQSMSLRSSRLITRTQGLLSTFEKENGTKLHRLSQRTQLALSGAYGKVVSKVSETRLGLLSSLAHGMDRGRSRLVHLRDRVPSAVRKAYFETRDRGARLTTRLQRSLSESERLVSWMTAGLSARLSGKISVATSAEVTRIPMLTHRLSGAVSVSRERTLLHLSGLSHRAELLDPSRIMARGFVVAVNEKGEPVTRISGLREGEQLTLSLLDGKAIAETKKIIPNT